MNSTRTGLGLACAGAHAGRLFLLAACFLALLIVADRHVAFAQAESCLACHGNTAVLRTASTRWREVYVDPVQYAKDKHGATACTACHGRGYVVYPHPAVEELPVDPAEPATIRQTCGACHEDITGRHLNSLHSTLEGHRLALISLMGEEKGMVRFQACTSCHATCTDCHMKQVDRYGRLASRTESHSFTADTPSQVCNVCHGQTGETYLGIPGDVKHGPSAMAVSGLECSDCHGEQSVHGTGARPSFMNETTKPTCEQCHSLTTPTVAGAQQVAPRQIDPANPAHETHEENVDCVACHTQWYTNCWDCHKGAPTTTETDKLFLGLNPLTGKIHTAVHSPINWELGGVAPEIGGWAVKTRHSWGKSQTCERCHTDPSVFVDPELRKGQFVGIWATEGAKASFVVEKRVQEITFDGEELARSPHKTSTCQDCHRSQESWVCTTCHNGEIKPGDRAPYTDGKAALEKSRRLLDQARELRVDVSALEKRHDGLLDSYRAVANRFHTDPVEAQLRMADVKQNAARLQADVAGAIDGRRLRTNLLTAGLPLLAGMVLAAGTGSYLLRGRKR